MSAEDWFRNRDWNDKIEAAFYEKLRRARRKEQYLRIQACILADSCPKVALKLLDEYFELKDDFDHAQVSDAPSGVDYIQLSSGMNHSCALTSEGAVECWGWDEYQSRSREGPYPYRIVGIVETNTRFSR